MLRWPLRGGGCRCTHTPLWEIQPLKTVLQLWPGTALREEVTPATAVKSPPPPVCLFLPYRKEITPPDLRRSQESPALLKTRQAPALLG